MNRNYYEFFAGGGMARAGLGADWTCIFANDFSAMKARTYRQNWGGEHLIQGDVAAVKADQLPGQAGMVWASFPCQDLSLAGKYRGFEDEQSGALTRSGTFWPFWSLMLQLKDLGRAPRLIVLENVPGAITSRNGRDFAMLCSALAEAGYRYGAVTIDARHFVPQSRPRLFFVAVRADMAVPIDLAAPAPQQHWHSDALQSAQRNLAGNAKAQWAWWKLPAPPLRNIGLDDIIEDHPTGCRWHSENETQRLLAMMAPIHRSKLEMAQKTGHRLVGCVYKRTRTNEFGQKEQRAEIRFDGLAGCLRTPGGGSSRQLIVVVDGPSTKSRLLSPREAARLMGLGDDYKLPDRYNEAYQVAGDGVCVPVVRFLAAHLLEPLLVQAATPDRSLAA